MNEPLKKYADLIGRCLARCWIREREGQDTHSRTEKVLNQRATAVDAANQAADEMTRRHLVG